jgi:hypothetical protein
MHHPTTSLLLYPRFLSVFQPVVPQRIGFQKIQKKALGVPFRSEQLSINS